MKKRIISIVLLLTMIISMLAGCNNNKKEDDKDDGDKQNVKYSVSVEPTSLELYIGEEDVIHATVEPAGAELKWSSSDPSVVTVNGGFVTGVGEGSATITASVGNKKATCQVTVLGERPEIGSDIGNECPSYSLDLVDGSGKVNIKDYKDKIVIINFWGTWCNPCISELPEFDRIASEYSDDVVVIAVHSTAGKSNASSYIKSNFADSKMIFAYDKPLSSVVDMYYDLLGGQGVYPRTLILDKRSIVSFTHDGMLSYDELKSEIEKLMPSEEQGGENNTPTTDSLVYDGSPVTITFYHTMNKNASAVLDNVIYEFNKLYPNITVFQENCGGYDDVYEQIKVELTVSNAPNIAYCYSGHVSTYNSIGAVVRLDDFINSDLQVRRADGSYEQVGFTDEQYNDYNSGLLDMGRIYDEEGSTYTLPFQSSNDVLYYNKTFFDRYGLTPPTTWDEMEQICQRIKEIDSNCTPLGVDSEANLFVTMAYQLGSHITSTDPNNPVCFDNAANRGFVKMLREWYDAGYLSTANICEMYMSNLLVDQECYMVIGSSAGASYHVADFDTAITTIPSFDYNSPGVVAQGPSLCIFNSENDMEVAASWLFVKYLTSNIEAQGSFSMTTGYRPVIDSVYNDPTYSAFLSSGDIRAESIKVSFEYADEAFIASPEPPNSAYNTTNVRDILTELILYSLLTNTSDIDGTIDFVFGLAMDAVMSN